MITDMALAALATMRLERTTLYSTSLLVIENWRRIAHSILSPSGNRSKTLAPSAHWLNELSVHIIHVVGLSSSSSFVVNSAMKSTKTCALIAVLGLYWTLNSPSFIAYRISYPTAFGLFIAFRSGLFIWTTMVCAWKYNLSFRVVVISAKASFSIRGYLFSTFRSI